LRALWCSNHCRRLLFQRRRVAPSEGKAGERVGEVREQEKLTVASKGYVSGQTKSETLVEVENEYLVLRFRCTDESLGGGNHCIPFVHHALTVVHQQTDGNRNIISTESKYFLCNAVFQHSEVLAFEIGDNVVYPHHGAGQVIKKEQKEILGEVREYLTIKILHNDMTVMVPCENAGKAGLRRVIDEDTVKKVLSVLSDDVSEMPKNWNRRFKHNRDKIKTGDIMELAEVVRNLAIREQDKGLSTGEKQMYTRAKKILASEMMYALDKDEEQAEAYLDEILTREDSLAGSASS